MEKEDTWLSLEWLGREQSVGAQGGSREARGGCCNPVADGRGPAGEVTRAEARILKPC